MIKKNSIYLLNTYKYSNYWLSNKFWSTNSILKRLNQKPEGLFYFITLMILEPKTWFVGNALWDEVYDLQVKEGVFPTHCEEVLVMHKWNIKSMRPQEIWDGMEVVKLKAKSWKLKDEIDKVNLISGMSIYQWFDENTWTQETYAYGIDRSKIDWINDVCKDLWLWVSLEDEKFVKITNWSFQIPEDWLLSFFFWLVLIYGKFTIVDEVLRHAVIQLPLVGSIAMQEEILLNLKEVLFEQELYLTITYLTQKSWQLLQVNIHDEEILDIWSSWLWWEAHEYDTLRNEIKNFAQIDEIDNYVLKFLHK